VSTSRSWRRQAFPSRESWGVRDIRAEYVGPNEVLSGMHVQVLPDLVLVEEIRIADEVRQRVGKISDAGYCRSRSTRRLPRRKEAIEGPSSPAERLDGLLVLGARR
jgi:hypothetical protein